MLYKVILTFESVDEILKCGHSNESFWCCLLYCTTGSNFLESVSEILKCDHSNESYQAVLSCGAVHYAVQGDFNF